MHLLYFLLPQRPAVKVIRQSETHYEVSARSNSTTFEVELTRSRFQPKRHRIEWKKPTPNSSRYLWVDGVRTTGGIDTMPEFELHRFAFRLNGKRIQVPRKLWGDLYEIHLEKGYTSASLLPAGKGLVLKTMGGDGYNSWGVSWTISPTGSIKRAWLDIG